MLILSKSRWQELQSNFDQVLDLPESERASYIEKNFHREEKQDLFALLKAADSAPSILNQAVPQELIRQSQITANRGTDTLLNTTIGPYTLIRQLGTGGMGTVYLAERSGEFTQQVAIKILRNEKSSEELLARFHQERQVLATLNHANIAKLYDGGVTPDGQTYIVMEYVKGLTLDEYCLKHQPDVESCLSLIEAIAKTVNYAHQHLVVHRDLKPSNIIVTETGSIKLLDFGIAKILKDEPAMALTQCQQMPMTPGFAAPEQIQNKAITVATDVYQLGIVSYFLFCRRFPFEFHRGSLEQHIQEVCHSLPAAPSIAIQQGNSECEVKAARKMAQALKGDLDAIVMKMLRPQPEKRYASMEEFLQDIGAYHNSMPVSARRSNTWYRLQCLFVRNWKAISVLGLIAIIVLAYTLVLNQQKKALHDALSRSQKERLKAEQVSTFMEQVFNSADPNVSGLEKVSAADLLEQGESKLIELENTPELKGHMANIFAQIWQRQGHYEHAKNILENQLVVEADSRMRADIALSYNLQSVNFLNTGDTSTAMDYSESSLAIYEALAGKTSEISADHNYARLIKAQIFSTQGNIDAAAPLVQEVISSLEIQQPPRIEYLAYAYAEQAIILHWQGKFNQAQAAMENALKMQEKLTGRNHSYYALMLVNLAVFYQDSGNFEMAEKYSRDALDIFHNIFIEDHQLSLHAERTLALILLKKGHLEEAGFRLATVVEKEMHAESKNSAQAIATHIHYATSLQESGKYQEAQLQYEMVKSRLTGQPKQENHARLYSRYASLKFSQGQLDEAAELYKASLEVDQASPLILSVSQLGLAQLLMETGDFTAASTHAELALQNREGVLKADHLWVIEARLLTLLNRYKLTGDKKIFVALQEEIEKARWIPGFKFGEKLNLLHWVEIQSSS